MRPLRLTTEIDMNALADCILFEILYQNKRGRYRAYGWSSVGMTRRGFANFIPQIVKERTARNDWRI
jgi:hypothetical protein